MLYHNTHVHCNSHHFLFLAKMVVAYIAYRICTYYYWHEKNHYYFFIYSYGVVVVAAAAAVAG